MSAHKVELLSPAKNLQIGIAAINHGADAVYIGYNQFGARAAAGNSITDIEALVKYAHVYGACVYVTLNTILYENELNQVQHLINTFYEIGVDALIIQDMGILEMDLPPIALHASTQTNNRTLQKVKFLEQAGFSRVVLARELSITDIAQISANTSVELEVFIHGALCVSYSGQCYLSQAITKRSANRGECAQPCRSRYDLVDENGKTIVRNKHLLSLKDLNQTENISALINAGVTSLKIEGRLKDIDYVKNITAHYRKTIDSAIASDSNTKKASSGQVHFMFTPDPERSFNRGFTTYFAKNRRKGLVSVNTQKSIGKLLGKVLASGKGWIEIDSKESINNNDGLCYFDNNEILNGVKVNSVVGKRISLNSEMPISKGTIINRNYDHKFRQLLLHDETAKRTIECKLNVEISHNKITLTLIDDDDLQTTLKWENTFSLANNFSSAEATLKKQLTKSSNTAFTITSVSVVLQNTSFPFVPMSVANQWRREIIATHSENRIKAHKRFEREFSTSNHPYPEPELNYLTNVSNSLAKKFYKRHGVSVVQPAFELQSKPQKIEAMRTKYCIAYELGMCQGNNTEQKLFLKDKNNVYPIEFSCSNCEMIVVSASK